MKMLVGKREVLIPQEEREALALAKICFGGAVNGGFLSHIVEVPGKCRGCGAKVKHTFSEDPSNGEVWFEGPVNCSECGHRFCPDPVPEMKLNQEQIIKIFGP